jgi:phosphate/sulfate permease
MFSNLMPQRREFYDLLTSHTDRLMAAANAVLRLVNALGTGAGALGISINLAVAWVLTIPASAAISAMFWWLGTTLL